MYTVQPTVGTPPHQQGRGVRIPAVQVEHRQITEGVPPCQ